MPRSAAPTVPSVQIDGFDELQPIGRGGFSYVFSARQQDFNRRVALKVLSFGLADERERRSFERECRAMGLVSQHPHIVTVFNAAFTTTKQPCIVMELYSGGTYGERQKREGQLPVALVLDVGMKIAGALQTAHDRGLLHRDIKPNNLFISEFGEPALGDFGISTLDDERSISGGGGLTVHYAPPEVLEGSPASPLSDVYSLAATLYTLLEGSDRSGRPRGPPVGRRAGSTDHARGAAAGAAPRRVPLARRAAGRGDGQAARRPSGVGHRARTGAPAGAGRARAVGDPAAVGDGARHAPAAAGPTRQGGRRRVASRCRRCRPGRPPASLPAPAPAPADAPASPSLRVDASTVGAVDDDDEHGHTVTVGRAGRADRRHDGDSRRARRGAS